MKSQKLHPFNLPQFSFLANSAEPDDTSGVATWVYLTENRGDEVEVVVKLQFNSFIEATEINKMIAVAYSAGLRAGDTRVCNAVDSAMREYR